MNIVSLKSILRYLLGDCLFKLSFVIFSQCSSITWVVFPGKLGSSNGFIITVIK
nr:MAG TPA: hypothetical protein [Bacteriophage sp.]